MLAVITTGMFLFVILVQSVLHRAERKDLYNRIMARDLSDYQVGENRSTNKADKTHVSKNPLKNKLDKEERERQRKYQNGELD